ncbi:MAG: AMP-binding protein, partial [Pseudomonadota bacterium]|nr:AMP-binding protein [Pseudomonadota bacterium]
QIHTSGTTGRPKGAMLTNANIMALARHAETGDLGAWSPDDVILVPLPLFHSGGTCFSLYGLYVGATTCLTREPRPDQMFDAFRRAPITKAGFVPAVIQMIVNHPDFDRDKVRSLKMVYYGGAPITAALLETAMEALGCGFLQMFGMTESTTAGTTLMPEDHDVTRPELLTSCGRVNSDMQLRIVDADRNDLPRGESGEIALKSPSIMKGYHNRPEDTAKVLVDGWYYTGDVGYLTEDGYLYIRDRLKDMIISGGENIYPAEIEQALAPHPAVLESGVVGVPSAKWGEEVKACVVLRPGQKADADQIITHCRTLLAGFKCPKSVDFLDALPRNANGKILKRVLREPYWPKAGRQVG